MSNYGDCNYGAGPYNEGGDCIVSICTAWITGADVADCCSVEASSGGVLDRVTAQADNLLFELSGRQFSGLCGPKTVSPPCVCSCGYQILSRGHIVGPWDWGYPLWNL